jgi:hypothetical protein
MPPILRSLSAVDWIGFDATGFHGQPTPALMTGPQARRFAVPSRHSPIALSGAHLDRTTPTRSRDA